MRFALSSCLAALLLAGCAATAVRPASGDMAGGALDEFVKQASILRRGAVLWAQDNGGGEAALVSIDQLVEDGYLNEALPGWALTTTPGVFAYPLPDAESSRLCDAIRPQDARRIACFPTSDDGVQSLVIDAR